MKRIFFAYTAGEIFHVLLATVLFAIRMNLILIIFICFILPMMRHFMLNGFNLEWFDEYFYVHSGLCDEFILQEYQ